MKKWILRFLQSAPEDPGEYDEEVVDDVRSLMQTARKIAYDVQGHAPSDHLVAETMRYVLQTHKFHHQMKMAEKYHSEEIEFVDMTAN